MKIQYEMDCHLELPNAPVCVRQPKESRRPVNCAQLIVPDCVTARRATPNHLLEIMMESTGVGTLVHLLALRSRYDIRRIELLDRNNTTVLP
jgi:hypothetical protein